MNPKQPTQANTKPHQYCDHENTNILKEFGFHYLPSSIMPKIFHGSTITTLSKKSMETLKIPTK